MIEEDLFVELAEVCFRTCRVLGAVAERKDADNLSGLNSKLEDLGRYVDPARPSLLTMTSDIRTIRHIESMVREHANCIHDPQEYQSGPGEERIIAWRAELRELSSVFEVRGCQLTVPTVSKLC